MTNSFIKFSCIVITLLTIAQTRLLSCTGITLHSKDSGVVVSRTVEWALSDAHLNNILIVPRKKLFKGLTPQGNNGKSWIGKYGYVSMTAYGQSFGPDGLNEEGLYVGVYYLPGFADYAEYDSLKAKQSLSLGSCMQWMLSSFKTVDDVLENLDSIIVVKMDSKEYGGASMPFHIKITDPSGNSRIIEIVNNGEFKIYEPVLGVITNSPTYDWHILNLSNYLNLSTNPSTPQTFGSYTLTKFGGGSGLIGLPGDFSSPSRFVRAVTFTSNCRPLNTSTDAVFESFRILDNFNIPLGAQVPLKKIPANMESVTQITSSSDLKNKIYYFHTMNNRNVRKIDLTKIDFENIVETIITDKKDAINEVKDITPRF